MRLMQGAGESVSAAGAAARRHVERFLDDNGLDPASVDAFVRKIVPGDHDIYFVSTIARGLAGPTSDIDLILVGKDFAVETGLTSMLFLGGRRMGLKTYRADDVAAAFSHIEALAAASFAERATTSPSSCLPPTSWTDLERLANGYSYTAGAPYAAQIVSLCQWSVARHALEFESASILAEIALAAQRPRAAAGYFYEALFAALDLVMAAGGQVQANRKWTMERWDIFQRCGGNDLSAIDAEMRQVARQLSDPSSYTELVKKTFPRLQGQLQRWCPELGSARLGLAVAEGAHATSFLKAATGLSNSRRSFVVDANTLEDLLAFKFSGHPRRVEGLVQETAEAALALLQSGLVTLKGFGHE